MMGARTDIVASGNCGYLLRNKKLYLVSACNPIKNYFYNKLLQTLRPNQRFSNTNPLSSLSTIINLNLNQKEKDTYISNEIRIN
jgi:hypothetical protein